MFYKLNDDGVTISQCTEEHQWWMDDTWQETSENIIRLHNGILAFEKDVDMQAEAQAIAEAEAEAQAIAEQEALKPTVEDLAEALDILTGIVLGGEE